MSSLLRQKRAKRAKSITCFLHVYRRKLIYSNVQSLSNENSHLIPITDLITMTHQNGTSYTYELVLFKGIIMISYLVITIINNLILVHWKQNKSHCISLSNDLNMVILLLPTKVTSPNWFLII